MGIGQMELATCMSTDVSMSFLFEVKVVRAACLPKYDPPRDVQLPGGRGWGAEGSVVLNDLSLGKQCQDGSSFQLAPPPPVRFQAAMGPISKPL